MEAKAIGWLAARHTRFDPERAEEAGVLFARKALVELALLVGLRVRLDPSALDPDFSLLLDQVADVAGRASYRELVVRDEGALLLYAGTYAALRLCGREDPDFHRAIEQAVSGGYAACFERIPYRQLDLLHTLELAGVDHGLPMVDAVLPHTLLCADPSAFKLADRDIYAITHTVFYATDFGLRTPKWPDGFDLARTVGLLEALLVLCRRRGNADLVAELVCSLLCLGVHDSAEADRAWTFLADTQEVDGRVDGPDGVVHPKLGEGNLEYQKWATGYHTTIVTALACLLARSPVLTQRPRPTVPLPADNKGLEEALYRSVVWLSGASLSDEAEPGFAPAAAATRGARALGQPALVEPALSALATYLDAAPDQLWSRYGVEAVAEFARGLSGLGLTCDSLERFLTSTAAALREVSVVPAGARTGIRILVDLGVLAADHGAALLASAPLAPPGTDDIAAGLVALQIAQRADQIPHPRDAGAESWRPVAECLAAALPAAYRDYRLGEMAALVRALALLGWGEHRLTRDAAAFLLSQQTPTGAIGYPACDCSDNRAEAHRAWTQSCVIALAELISSRPLEQTASVMGTANR
ncbi:hypothetical protein BN159_8415 [Streptomyces davaonensis JCM 4913]|uniref:DUF6895 domain-containing protein n=1 Tax=Streptomyces davaonensis (strain DSM 101723 / JCM 4913 / KCC S-0913 / 768) TaxID=1214101 RepID=K4RFW0_STRDJ|nr:hypothetical protein BN159_8415 [Streptomyces davaonensis JCM 4913]